MMRSITGSVNLTGKCGAVESDAYDIAMPGCRAPIPSKGKQRFGAVSCREWSIETQTAVVIKDTLFLFAYSLHHPSLPFPTHLHQSIIPPPVHLRLQKSIIVTGTCQEPTFTDILNFYFQSNSPPSFIQVPFLTITRHRNQTRHVRATLTLDSQCLFLCVRATLFPITSALRLNTIAVS